MEQVGELNARLTDRYATIAVTLDDLGLVGDESRRLGHDMSGRETVMKVAWFGSPSFPDIYVVLAVNPATQQLKLVLLQPDELRTLSRLVHCTHHWSH